ncbi:nitroreductase/quinone reductase family protein [Microterricola viridarii]|uniref:Deazaflavin-dependent oxidoreductase, nitroreductase family n=1 Tax=Microterricola viridarii TaxID=412690 RepID=A0A1H1WB33_9MICO|nr:nitroreductase/quinone reductase family protein [Microterricola viridarii]SDS93850.1 deazaflavin-dependent oxidoreductase, nitroreductase family [Microterricola viridarii]
MSERPQNWTQMIIDEFRANNGTVTTAGFGRRLVLLHQRGAQTGVERITPVTGIRSDENTWLVAASQSGSSKNPHWYYNLRAHPDVMIETPDAGIVPVRARELPRAERDAAWPLFVAANPAFAEYEHRTSRVIPVFSLTRRRGA